MADGIRLSGRIAGAVSPFISYIVVGDNSLNLSAVQVTGLSVPTTPSFSAVDLGTDIVIHSPNSVIGIPVPQVELERMVNGHAARNHDSHPHPEYSNGGHGNRFYNNGSARRRF